MMKKSRGAVTIMGMILAALLGAILGLTTYLSEPNTVPMQPAEQTEKGP